MTKLAIMSDLHIDVNGFSDLEINTLLSVLQSEKIEHLHLAGDTANDFKNITLPFLARLQSHLAISFNLGNHDMLGLSEHDIENYNGCVIDFDTHRLISLAGWYDYSFNATKSEAQLLADKNFYWFDRKLNREGSDPKITQKSLDWLEKQLAQTKQPVIVSMHFVPHADFIIDHPYFQRFNAFLGSQKFHDLFVKHGVKKVVFGHLHHRHDRMIDGIHYQARPLGYTREWRLVRHFFEKFPQYDSQPKYHLSKRYHAIKNLAEFNQFYQQELANEFRQALTIFDI